MGGYVLAVDQGTTSSRAIIFDEDYRVRGFAQAEFPQIFPQSGWVEHDPEDLWRTVISTMREALAGAGLAATAIAAIGIANQRETTLLWERATGKPLH
ncbi:MAG: FGGY family carbohydrate kinase, partial [Rhizomicrobium sp.]